MDEKRLRTIFISATALLLLISWLTHAGLWREVRPVQAGFEAGLEFYGPPLPPIGGLEGMTRAELLNSMPGLYEEHFINEEREGTISHVSSIVSLDGGRMAASWYSGSREGAKDVRIYYSVFDKGQWSSFVPVVSRESAMEELGHYVKKVGNSMLARDSEGRIWLFYASIAAGGWSGTSLNYKHSGDEGITWSRSRKLILSPVFNLTDNVKNKAMPLKGGGFLIPAYYESVSKRSELVRLLPEGRYVKTRMTNTEGAIQPSLLHDGGTRLSAFMRDFKGNGPRRVMFCESHDMGKSWGPLMLTSLRNPNAGLDVVQAGEGLIAVLNDLDSDRHRLSLAYSPDGGRTWDELWVFEDQEGNEYSYPFIARGDDGVFHVTYTYERKRIKHVMFDQEWLDWLKGNVR